MKTALGGIYTGLLVIVCLAFLMPFCAFIPKATLAAVIMTAVIFSVEHHVIRPMWSSKSESLHVGRSESKNPTEFVQKQDHSNKLHIETVCFLLESHHSA